MEKENKKNEKMKKEEQKAVSVSIEQPVFMMKETKECQREERDNRGEQIELKTQNKITV